jgi:putative membrane protein
VTTRERTAVTVGVAREYLSVYLKGLFMGAADTVPGVSGGTIALVTGIYERLIAAVTAADPADLRHLPRVYDREARRSLVTAFFRVDGPFLLALGAGVATAVVTLSRVLEVVFETSPGVVWAFFFGLIAASAVVLRDAVDLGTPRRAGLAVVGVAAAAGLSAAGGSGATPHALPVLALAGAIAVSAMVLPGVSGSFLLLLLGQYEFMIARLNDFVDALVGVAGGDGLGPVLAAAPPVVVFVAGAVLGLLTVAHAVRRALSTHRAATLTVLVSLMIGGLYLPAEGVIANVAATPAALAPAALAAFAGAVGVVVFDRYTDDLEYDSA